MDKKDFPTLPKIIKNLLDEYAKHDYLYWYPLNPLKKEIPVIAYHLDAIYKDNKIMQIESCLSKMSICECDSFQAQINMDEIKRVNLIDLLYEKDADGYDFPWCVETYYFDGDHSDWIIYVSHEGTITFTGQKIVETARSTIESVYIIDTKTEIHK